MKRSQALLLFFGISVCLLVGSVAGLKCYVCDDCDADYNETQLIECDKEEKCTKTVEAGSDDKVSRSCGSKALCTKQIRPASNTKKKSDKVVKPSPTRRKRSLLSTGTKKPTGPPPPPITSLHCCDDEDGCNVADHASSSQSLIFLSLLIRLVLSFY